MRKFGKIKIFLVLVLLVFLGSGTVFFSRSPVLIVTDFSFELLYGPVRLWFRGLRTSFALFRRVIPVMVSESAGPDLVSLAVTGISSSPRAVFFPYRYLEGALFYRERHPEIPVLVACEGNLLPGEQSVTFVTTDTAADLYRAGLYAALLAGEKQVIFFTDRYFSGENRNAFREGLRSRGFFGEPVYSQTSEDSFSQENLGCLVMAGNAAAFLEQNLSVPVILFSWASPAYIPRTVKLIFDDSPWGLAAGALGEFPPPGGEILIPSEPLLLLGRMEKKSDFFRHRALLRGKMQKN